MLSDSASLSVACSVDCALYNALLLVQVLHDCASVLRAAEHQ
jgi:hypothetical protein